MKWTRHKAGFEQNKNKTFEGKHHLENLVIDENSTVKKLKEIGTE
jgi:hypothetical protein